MPNPPSGAARCPAASGDVSEGGIRFAFLRASNAACDPYAGPSLTSSMPSAQMGDDGGGAMTERASSGGSADDGR